MKKILSAIIIFYFMMGVAVLAVEPADLFIIKDIQYQSFSTGGGPASGGQDQAKLAIIMNTYIESVSYELEGPYRIIIDPLEEVYCDYQDKVYFEEGLIKSIEFIKTRERSEAPGELYYAFDFLAIELKEPVYYKVIKEGPNILLDIGEIREISEAPEIVEAPVAPPAEEGFEERFVEVEPEEKPPALRAVGSEMPPVIREEKTIEEEPKEEEKKEEFEKEAEETEAVREIGGYEETTFITPDLTKELTLEDCVKIALDNHLPIKIAEEQVKLAKLKVNESFRELFPTASLLWSESHGMIQNELYRGRKYGFEFRQSLFHGGELVFTWEQSKVNLKVTQENYNKVKEELIHDVSKAYYELAKALNNLDLQKELFEDIRSNLELAKKEYELSLSTQLEFLNAQSSYDQVFYSIASSENDVSLKRLALNKVMNIDISMEVKIDYRLELKDFDIDIDGCTELAMQHRAELRTRELMVKSTELGERIAQSQIWPRLDVMGKYVKAAEEYEPRALGWNLRNEFFLGVTADIPFGSHTFEVAHKRGKLAPTVTTFESATKYNTDLYKINLFDKLERYTDMKSAYIARQQAASDLRDVKRNIHSEVREAFFALREAQIKIKGSLNNLKLYEKELQVTQVRKGLNEATVSEVMDAKIKLFGEKATFINAMGDIYLAIASLNKAIGMGGYFK